MTNTEVLPAEAGEEELQGQSAASLTLWGGKGCHPHQAWEHLRVSHMDLLLEEHAHPLSSWQRFQQMEQSGGSEYTIYGI